MTKSHSISHPALTLTHARADVWTRLATDEDFYKYIDGLKTIYAKRKREDGQRLDEQLLIEDYNKWKKEKRDEIW